MNFVGNGQDLKDRFLLSQ